MAAKWHNILYLVFINKIMNTNGLQPISHNSQTRKTRRFPSISVTAALTANEILRTPTNHFAPRYLRTLATSSNEQIFAHFCL